MVNQPRDLFLSGPGFTGDEDRASGRGGLERQVDRPAR
jgi:hypothetical protein